MPRKDNNLQVSLKEKIQGYWKDGLSIDETKVSALIVSLFITLAFTLTMYALTSFAICAVVPSVLDNSAKILTAFIWAIAGVNMTEKITTFFNNWTSTASTPTAPAAPTTTPTTNNTDDTNAVG